MLSAAHSTSMQQEPQPHQGQCAAFPSPAAFPACPVQPQRGVSNALLPPSGAPGDPQLRTLPPFILRPT